MPDNAAIDSQTLALQQMKGVDLPASVSPWPLAPGWWGVILTLILVTVALARRWWRATALRRAAVAALDRLHERYQQRGDPAELVKGLSILLRRIALARHPRRQVAGLQGDDWLAFLDRTGDGDGPGFSNGPGRVLITLPYGGDEPVDVAALMALSRCWIRRNT